jgi:hypothetical protein
MLTELIAFKASDGFPLDGLLYASRSGAGKRVALIVHGKTMNFYSLLQWRGAPIRKGGERMACKSWPPRCQGEIEIEYRGWGYGQKSRIAV